MRGAIAAIAFLSTSGEGLKVFLDKRRKQSHLSSPLGVSFNRAADACCACFKVKFAWTKTDNGKHKTVAPFGPAKTCATCYVMDRYGIHAERETTEGVSADDESKMKDDLQHGNYGNFYHMAYGYWQPSTHKSVENEAYKKINSRQEKVSEWNWSCASGDISDENPFGAPEIWRRQEEWRAGPVNAEPPVRSNYRICDEHSFRCSDPKGIENTMAKDYSRSDVYETEPGSNNNMYYHGGQSYVYTTHLPEIGESSQDYWKRWHYYD